MTGFNAVQLVLAAGALATAIARLRVLWFEAELDLERFLDAFETAYRANQLSLARRIAQSCLPAWPARLALDALARIDSGRYREELDQDLAETASAAWRGRAALLTLGRIAGPLALIGVILELGNALHESGLVALQRGLPVRLAIERSLLTFAIGLATTIACFAAASALDRGARRIGRALERVAAVLAPRAPTEPRPM